MSEEFYRPDNVPDADAEIDDDNDSDFLLGEPSNKLCPSYVSGGWCPNGRSCRFVHAHIPSLGKSWITRKVQLVKFYFKQSAMKQDLSKLKTIVSLMLKINKMVMKRKGIIANEERGFGLGLENV